MGTVEVIEWLLDHINTELMYRAFKCWIFQHVSGGTYYETETQYLYVQEVMKRLVSVGGMLQLMNILLVNTLQRLVNFTRI